MLKSLLLFLLIHSSAFAQSTVTDPASVIAQIKNLNNCQYNDLKQRQYYLCTYRVTKRTSEEIRDIFVNSMFQNEFRNPYANDITFTSGDGELLIFTIEDEKLLLAIDSQIPVIDIKPDFKPLPTIKFKLDLLSIDEEVVQGFDISLNSFIKSMTRSFDKSAIDQGNGLNVSLSNGFESFSAFIGAERSKQTIHIVEGGEIYESERSYLNQSKLKVQYIWPDGAINPEEFETGFDIDGSFKIEEDSKTIEFDWLNVKWLQVDPKVAERSIDTPNILKTNPNNFVMKLGVPRVIGTFYYNESMKKNKTRVLGISKKSKNKVQKWVIMLTAVGYHDEQEDLANVNKLYTFEEVENNFDIETIAGMPSCEDFEKNIYFTVTRDFFGIAQIQMGLKADSLYPILSKESQNVSVGVKVKGSGKRSHLLINLLMEPREITTINPSLLKNSAAVEMNVKIKTNSPGLKCKISKKIRYTLQSRKTNAIEILK
ncbi:MAG: hypothetical protein H6621_02730 [Halobacteriovoraceae bacterium]|nr:hypothetical protein [Halobacteriovoraceae bacterium]MCB9093959.1 hypothetical protein [Halobacteriovoraceae bacterium]